MRTRAVVFDFYGTLTRGRSSPEQHAARIAQAEALGVHVAAFDAELTATYAERFAGAGGSVEGSLAWLTRRLGLDVAPERLAEAARVRLATERVFGEPRDGAVPVLSDLRARGLRIGLVSDCSAELPEYFAELPVAPLIDTTVFSFVLGSCKPAAANYLAASSGLGVAPEECLYVGDGGSDELTGAAAVGMRPVLLAVPGERTSVVYGRDRAWDGEMITSLDQVADLV